MIHVIAPTSGLQLEGTAVFLAGAITGGGNWQRSAAGLLSADDAVAVVYNPYRVNFPIDDPTAARSQIEWEFHHIAQSDVLLFWFPDTGAIPQPIALFELGAYVAGCRRRAAVGADPNYVRRVDIVEQLRLARPDVNVWDTLGDTVTEARRLVRNRL